MCLFTAKNLRFDTRFQRSPFLAERFVFHNKKKENKESDTGHEASKSPEELITDEMMKSINGVREIIAKSVGSKANVRELIAALNDRNFVRTNIVTAMKEKSETDQKSINQLLHQLHEIYRNKKAHNSIRVAELLKPVKQKLETLLGIPVDIINIQLHEVLESSNVQKSIEELERFIDERLTSIAEHYVNALKNINQIELERVMKRETDGLRDLKLTEKQSENILKLISDVSHKNIEKAEKKIREEYEHKFIDPIANRAFELFRIADEEQKKRLLADEMLKTQIIRFYARYKENSYSIAINEKLLADENMVAPDRGEFLSWIEHLKEDQKDIVSHIEWIKRKVTLINNIEELGLDNVTQNNPPHDREEYADTTWLGTLPEKEKSMKYSLGTHFRNVIRSREAAQKEIDDIAHQIPNLGPIQDSMGAYEAPKEDENKKKRQELEKALEEKQKRLVVYDEVINKAIEHTSKREEGGTTKTDIQNEVRNVSRNEAIDYLWDRWQGKILELKQDPTKPQLDRQSIRAMLENPALPFPILIDYYMRQRLQETQASSGHTVLEEFINQFRDTVEALIKVMGLRNGLIERYLYSLIKGGSTAPQSKDLEKMLDDLKSNPGSLPAITPSNAPKFFEAMFQETLSNHQGSALDKIYMRSTADIIKPYLDPNQKGKEYAVIDKKGTKHDKSFAARGQMLVQQIIKKYLENMGVAHPTATKDSIATIIKKEWDEKLLPDILKHDDNTAKIQKHAQNACEDDKELKTEFDKEQEDPAASAERKGTTLGSSLFGNGLTFIGAMTGGWHGLSFNVFLKLGSTVQDYYKRRMELYNMEQAFAAGQVLATYIPFGGDQLLAELTKAMQSKENEEVSNIQSSYKQYGYDQLKSQMYAAKNPYFLKAALLQLVENGWLLDSDFLNLDFRRGCSKLFPACKNIDITTPPERLTEKQRTDLMDAIGKGIDAKWGNSTMVNWINNSEGARQSNIQKNANAFKKYPPDEREKMLAKYVRSLIKREDESDEVYKERMMDFKKRNDPAQVLGALYSEFDTGSQSTAIQLPTVMVLLMEGAIEDSHIASIQNTYFNVYPAFALMTRTKAEHSGFREIYEKEKGTLIKKDALQFNDENLLYRFFAGTVKLPLKAQYNPETKRWVVARTAEQAADPNFETVYIGARDVQKDSRLPNFQQFPDNSCIQLYANYSPNDLRGNLLRRGNSGQMERNPKSSDLCSLYAGLANEITASIEGLKNLKNEFAKPDGRYKDITQDQRAKIFREHFEQVKTATRNAYDLVEYILEVQDVTRRVRIRDADGTYKVVEKKFEKTITTPPNESNFGYLTDDERGLFRNEPVKYMNSVLAGEGTTENSVLNGIKEMMGMTITRDVFLNDKKLLHFHPGEHMHNLVQNINTLVRSYAGEVAIPMDEALFRW